MKNTPFLILAAATLLAAGTAFADDVAVLDIQTAGEPGLKRVVLELYENDAPATVANFKKLAKSNFYNGVAFHRIFPSLMVQTGDPLSKSKGATNIGTGGPGYTLPPEINRRKHVAGTVGAGRLSNKVNPAKVSNGSQFYITLAPSPSLDGQYTVFGGVIQGLDVLEALSQKPTDTNDSPVDRVAVQSLQIVPREKAATVAPKGESWLNKLSFGLLK